MKSADADRGEIPELRTAAILVWHYQQVEGGGEAWAAMLKTKEEQSQRVETFRAELYRIVGTRDDIRLRINGGCVEAEIEDLRFVALESTTAKTQERMTLVTLLGRCPSCGVETMSEPLFNLANLGRMLEKFEPVYEHICSRLWNKTTKKE